MPAEPARIRQIRQETAMPRWMMGCLFVVLGSVAFAVCAVLVMESGTDDTNDEISRERCEREFQLIRERPLESDISVVRACNRAGFRPPPRVNYSRERCEREFRLSLRSPLDADDSVLSDCDRAGLLPFDRLDEFLPR